MPSKKKGQFSVEDIEPSGGKFSDSDVQTDAPAEVVPTPEAASPSALTALIDRAKQNWRTGTTDTQAKGAKAALQNFGAHTATSLRNAAQGAYKLATMASSGAMGDESAGEMHPLDAAKAYAQSVREDVHRDGFLHTVPKLLGDLSGNILAGGVTDGLGGPVAEVAERASLPGAEVFAPHEYAANQITKAVNPAYPVEYARSVANQGGNIIDYAKRSGIPLTSQGAWEKAATGMADEASTHYKVLRDAVPGKHSVGPTFGDRMTIGEIDKRVSDLNDALRPAYQTNSSGDMLTSLNQKAAMVAEKNHLTEILHEKIGEAHGISSDDVGALRQRVGQARDIADQTRARRFERANSAGRKNEGDKTGTMGKTGLLREGVNVVRGGAEKIADKSITKAAAQYARLPELSVTELPQPVAVAPPVDTLSGISTQQRLANAAAQAQINRRFPPLSR